MSEKNIYQRINAVIDEGIYIKRGSAGSGTGVLYDEAISVLRPILAKNGIVFNVEKRGESKSRETKKGTYIFECDYAVTYINIDNPDDRFTNVVEAHAMDSGDKAPGKAITYATKISLLKVFQIETGENDESREEIKEKSKLVTPEQAAQLAEYCFTTDENGNPQWSAIGKKLANAYNISSPQELLASNFEAALSRCKKAAEAEKNANH